MIAEMAIVVAVAVWRWVICKRNWVDAAGIFAWVGGVGVVGAGIDWPDLVSSEGSALPVPGKWNVGGSVAFHGVGLVEEEEEEEVVVVVVVSKYMSLTQSEQEERVDIAMMETKTVNI